MKQILILVLILSFSCSAPRQETAKIDSLALARDTLNDFSNTGDPETVLDEPLESFLERTLPPKDSDSDSVFTIGLTRVMDQSFVDISGQCVQPGVVVFVARSRHGAEQPEGMEDNGDDLYDIQYDILTAIKDDKGVMAVDKLNVNKWSAPADYTADVIDEFALSDACPVLAIRYDNKGGEKDLPWHKTAVTFYLYTPGGFNQVLEVFEENSFTMANFGGGPAHPVSEIGKIELLDQTTNGFKEIRVTTTSGLVESPGDVTKKVSTYYFDGAQFVLR